MDPRVTPSYCVVEKSACKVLCGVRIERDKDLTRLITTAAETTLPPRFVVRQIVGPMLSSQASSLETVSSNFLGLPLVTPSASAARAATYLASGTQEGLGAGASYLFGVQPDVFEQMKALARLVLDMKTERDYSYDW